MARIYSNEARAQKAKFMVAAKKGHVKALAKALALQAELAKGVDEDGRSALMLAAERGHAACVELLLPGSDPLAVFGYGRSALMLAADGGHAECVELLLSVSAPLAVTWDGMSALMFAAEKGHAACVELLLAVSDPLAVDECGRSALMCAVWSKSLKCVDLLLPSSDLAVKAFDGPTALDLARARGCQEVLLAIECHETRLEAAELSKHIHTAPISGERGAAAPRRSARL